MFTLLSLFKFKDLRNLLGEEKLGLQFSCNVAKLQNTEYFNSGEFENSGGYRP